MEPASSYTVSSNQTMFGSAYNPLFSNQYFSAGAGLAGLGALMALSRKLLIIGNSLFRRKFISTLELDNEDHAYHWVLSYVNKHSSHRTNKLTVNTALSQSESGRTSTNFVLLPGRGTHYFSYNTRWVKVERTREKQVIQRDGIKTALETVTLSTLAMSPKFWVNFLEKAAGEALSQLETDLVIYTAVGPEWHQFGNPRTKRPIDSIILDTGVSEFLRNDLDQFLSSKKWYTSRGIPYRRGYLLHGPPGTGKSSFIAALAGLHGYSICTLSLSDRTLDDDRLNHLLNNTPPYSFVLLEDIDVAVVPREPLDNSQFKAYEGLVRATMSGLLNAIDGVTSSEERILFMTTNFVERLDSALIRPGRVDVKQYFGNCSPVMLKSMFKLFYENCPEHLAQEFADKLTIPDRTFSPATIQGHFMKYKIDPEKSLLKHQDLISIK